MKPPAQSALTSDDALRADPVAYRRRWSILDRDGKRHLPLRQNDDEAIWTPIACGGGVVWPFPQARNPVTCPDCIKARRKNGGRSS